MKRFATCLAALLALSTPAALRADALADLRTKLAALKPAGAFAARIDIRSTSTKGDEDDASRIERTAAIAAIQDGAGIRLQWSASAIAAARRGKTEQERNPEARQSGGLAELSAISASALLDAAPVLLLRLEGAALVETRPDHYQGRPALLILVIPRNPMSEKDRKRVKKYVATLKIWVDDQGWPLAMEEKIRVRYSFMFIGVTLDNSTTEVYVHTVDRLYVTEKKEENLVAGLGQKGGTRATLNVTPQGEEGKR